MKKLNYFITVLLTMFLCICRQDISIEASKNTHKSQPVYIIEYNNKKQFNKFSSNVEDLSTVDIMLEKNNIQVSSLTN